MSPAARHLTDYSAFVAHFTIGSGRQALDGFDRRRLLALTDAERQAAVDLLTAALASDRNDPRIPPALSALAGAAARPALQQRLAHSLDDTALAAAVELLQPPADPSVPAALCELLRDAPRSTTRAQAAHLVGELAGTAPTDALLEALGDRDPDVRSSAADALAARCQLQPAELDGGPLPLLRSQLPSPVATTRDPAIAELRRLFRALAAGQSPDSLGLRVARPPESAALQRLRTSVFGIDGQLGPSPPAVDLEAFAALSGDERSWGQQFILSLIRDGDERGIAAAALLRTDWALAALRQLVADQAYGADHAQLALAALVE